MAQSVQAAAENEQLIFKGKSRAMNASIGMLVAGVLTFSMGMNRLFFVEAMAWTFIVWGALLLYGHIIDYSTTYEVTDEGLIVRSPVRFWNLTQKMEWGQVKRLNVVVSRLEATACAGFQALPLFPHLPAFPGQHHHPCRRPRAPPARVLERAALRTCIRNHR